VLKTHQIQQCPSFVKQTKYKTNITPSPGLLAKYKKKKNIRIQQRKSVKTKNQNSSERGEARRCEGRDTCYSLQTEARCGCQCEMKAYGFLRVE